MKLSASLNDWAGQLHRYIQDEQKTHYNSGGIITGLDDNNGAPVWEYGWKADVVREYEHDLWSSIFEWAKVCQKEERQRRLKFPDEPRRKRKT